MTPMPVVFADDLVRTYHVGGIEVAALRGVTLSLEAGEYLAVMGPSGSGKSTLLNVLGCLDRPTHGRYCIDGDDVSFLDDDALSEIRGRRIGFIFQSYNLINQLNVLENIEVPMVYRNFTEDESLSRARHLADIVGLGHRLFHRPYELSGGQQQRVAIARALANDPLMILADEPTGNLDTVSGGEIMSLLDDLHEQGKTVVVVTHDARVADRAQRVIHMLDGRIDRDHAGGKR